MDNISIGGEEIPDYDKKATWNLLHAYIDAHSQILTDGCIGDGVQAILILQSQYTNMTFYYQSRYNGMFQQVVHKGGDSEIDYIQRHQSAKTLEISEGSFHQHIFSISISH